MESGLTVKFRFSKNRKGLPAKGDLFDTIYIIYRYVQPKLIYVINNGKKSTCFTSAS